MLALLVCASVEDGHRLVGRSGLAHSTESLSISALGAINLLLVDILPLIHCHDIVDLLLFERCITDDPVNNIVDIGARLAEIAESPGLTFHE